MPVSQRSVRVSSGGRGALSLEGARTGVLRANARQAIGRNRRVWLILRQGRISRGFFVLMCFNMVSAGAYFAILALLLFVGIAIFWLLTALKFGAKIGAHVFTRAVSITGANNSGTLACPADRKINIFRARYVCGTLDGAHPAMQACDDPGLSSGNYSPTSTSDASNDLRNVCEGKSNCVFTLPAGVLDAQCANCDADLQLNASYDCRPA